MNALKVAALANCFAIPVALVEWGFSPTDILSVRDKISSPSLENWLLYLNSIRGAIFMVNAGKHTLEVRTWVMAGSGFPSIRRIASVILKMSR